MWAFLPVSSNDNGTVPYEQAQGDAKRDAKTDGSLAQPLCCREDAQTPF